MIFHVVDSLKFWSNALLIDLHIYRLGSQTNYRKCNSKFVLDLEFMR